MGELLLCHESIAALPYYVDEIGQNLYSMEELSYYIAGSVYLLDRSFMNEELCTWIEKQMKRSRLAGQLRDHMHAQGKLSEFVRMILEDTAYCTMQEMQDIVFAVRQMEERSDFECKKLRADQLLEKQKTLAAIYAYKKLLESDDAKTAPHVLCGNIWHNLGTAYAGLFLFEEAAYCYGKAYAANASGESLRECLLCYLVREDEEGFLRAAQQWNLDEMGMQEIRNEIAIAQKSDSLHALLEEIDDIEQTEDQERAQKLLLQWKEDYRKSCRV